MSSKRDRTEESLTGRYGIDSFPPATLAAKVMWRPQIGTKVKFHWKAIWTPHNQLRHIRTKELALRGHVSRRRRQRHMLQHHRDGQIEWAQPAQLHDLSLRDAAQHELEGSGDSGCTDAVERNHASTFQGPHDIHQVTLNQL